MTVVDWQPVVNALAASLWCVVVVFGFIFIAFLGFVLENILKQYRKATNKKLAQLERDRHVSRSPTAH